MNAILEFVFSSPEFTTVGPSLRPPNIASIAGIVAGALACLTLVIIMVCVCKKRRSSKRVEKGFEGVTFTAVSMRDRIRAESLRALDQSKVLSLFDPDDIKQFPLSHVEYVRDLGSGNFGLVFLGTYRSSRWVTWGVPSNAPL